MTQASSKLREQWRPVLDAEVERRSAKSCEQLTTELAEEKDYEVEFNGKNLEVDVQPLENNDKYVHVMVAVDDGNVPASFRPLSTSFIRKRNGEGDKRIANDERLTTND